MRNLLTLAAFLLTFLPLHAQGDYEDLLVLYVDEDYEKCISKAERYTERDQTRRDALPFLFLSMCYFEISKRTTRNASPRRSATPSATRPAAMPCPTSS